MSGGSNASPAKAAGEWLFKATRVPVRAPFEKRPASTNRFF
jgi:multidrug resistance efflux pump